MPLFVALKLPWRRTVKQLSTFGYYQLTLLGKPAADRTIYQLIKKHKFHSFVEIGMGTGQRCQRILQVASKFGGRPIRYTGIDLFDARTENPLKLIDMHKMLGSFDAKTQLVPGSIEPSIQRIANSHLRTDMIIISPDTQQSDLNNVMSYLPRMLHANSMVLIQPRSGQKMKQLMRLDIERWAKKVKTNQKTAQSKQKSA